MGRMFEAASDPPLEKWRKSWMHPCVRCVSKLRVRCVASWPCNFTPKPTGSDLNQGLGSEKPRLLDSETATSEFAAEPESFPRG